MTKEEEMAMALEFMKACETAKEVTIARYKEMIANTKMPKKEEKEFHNKVLDNLRCQLVKMQKTRELAEKEMKHE